MQQFTSEDLGKIQVNKVKKALSGLSLEGKGFVEKTNRLENGEVQENDSILFDLFGKKSDAFTREYARLFTLFNGKVSRDNLTEFLDEVGKSRVAVKLERPIRDNRKPKEELEERQANLKLSRKGRGRDKRSSTNNQSKSLLGRSEFVLMCALMTQTL